MLLDVKFSDFSTQDTYCKLQNRFLAFDERGKVPNITEPLESLEIIYSHSTFVEDDLIKMDFFSDFLDIKIKKLHKSIISKFIKTIRDNHLYGNDSKNGLATEYLDKINKFRIVYENASYLSDAVRSMLSKELDTIEIFIEKYLKNPFTNIKNKVQFNWNRIDVIYLFHLLRLNGCINEISDANLGRILDSLFEYKSDENYEPLTNSRKHLNDFKHTSGRPENAVNSRLMEIFSSDFFNN